MRELNERGHPDMQAAWLASESQVVELKQAAERGDPFALAAVGEWHVFGMFGCEVDEVRAHDLLLQAAEKGHRRAQYRLGMLLWDGAGPHFRSFENAVHWYMRAAIDGDYVPALTELAIAYIEGKGVEQDVDRGIEIRAGV